MPLRYPPPPPHPESIGIRVRVTCYCHYETLYLINPTQTFNVVTFLLLVLLAVKTHRCQNSIGTIRSTMKQKATPLFRLTLEANCVENYYWAAVSSQSHG